VLALELRCQTLELFGLSRGEDEAGAARGEGSRDRSAESARGASQENSFAVEVDPAILEATGAGKPFCKQILAKVGAIC